MSGTMGDFLAKAIEGSRARVVAAEMETPLTELEEIIWNLPPARSLEAALRGAERLHIIAEMKRASPSAGSLTTGYDPRTIAGDYARGGAAAISVLTEPEFFKGEIAHLALAGEAKLPVIRKDFLVSPYQIAESRIAGADAVLLIVAALGEVGLRQMIQAAGKYGLSTLVEAHGADELEIAAGCAPRFVGVNCRDLRTLKVDPRRCLELAPLLPRSVVRVAESGVSSPEQVRALRRARYDAALIGEAFMRADDRAAAVASLVAAGAGL